MFNIDKYLTVKWRMGGRVYPILDCYGIVHEVRKDLGLPAWPVFEGVIKEGDSMDATARGVIRDATRCGPEHGAVAACYKGGMISHVGIVVLLDGQLQVIESNPRNNVTILPLARFERRYVKVEYYQ
ncbi:nitrite transporter [Phytobacter palmae]|uniref:Nitrite transporter n=1 Tax=Phytobacter palmae TaxID=1855371 RepID=A0ABU9VC46_9ENTR